MPPIDQLGWADPVGTLLRLQMAMRTLAEGKKKIRDRLDDATFALVTLDSRDLPERLRYRLDAIFDLRVKTRREIGDYVAFHFDVLTPTERKVLVAHVTALYEACLIDVGRMWPEYDFLYPKDQEPTRPRRRRKSKR